MAETKVLIHPYIVYECPDCGGRTATNIPDEFPTCPCGTPGEAMEFVDVCEMVPGGLATSDTEAGDRRD